MLVQSATQIPFVVILLVVLVLAKVLGEIMEHFGQPSMIGEVLAGIILGPSVLSLIHAGDVSALSELGVFMLIMMAGMEIEVEEIRNSIRGRNGLIAVLGFLIPFITGAAIGYFFNFNTTLSIILGLCIAITALPVSIRILMDLGKLNSDVGRMIISAAIFNDVLSLLILGVILDFTQESKALKDLIMTTTWSLAKVMFFMAFLIIAYKLFKLVKRKVRVINPRFNKFMTLLRGKESLFALVIMYVLAFASIAEWVGLHFIVGAFFGAILVPRSIFAKGNLEKVKTTTSVITIGFLGPIFFASIGMSFALTSLGDYPLMITILIVSFLSKIIGGYYGGRFSGMDKSKSLALGLGLNARGIMELVIANVALQRGFISQSVFSILVLMALLTTLLTPIFLKRAFQYIDRGQEKIRSVTESQLKS